MIAARCRRSCLRMCVRNEEEYNVQSFLLEENEIRDWHVCAERSAREHLSARACVLFGKRTSRGIHRKKEEKMRGLVFQHRFFLYRLVLALSLPLPLSFSLSLSLSLSHFPLVVVGLS